MPLNNRVKALETSLIARRNKILKPFFAAIGLEKGQRWIDIFCDYHTKGIEPGASDLEFITELDPLLGRYVNAVK